MYKEIRIFSTIKRNKSCVLPDQRTVKVHPFSVECIHYIFSIFHKDLKSLKAILTTPLLLGVLYF